MCEFIIFPIEFFDNWGSTPFLGEFYFYLGLFLIIRNPARPALLRWWLASALVPLALWAPRQC